MVAETDGPGEAPQPTVSTGEEPQFFELSLFRAPGNVRIALLILGFVVVASSPDRVGIPLASYTGLIVGVFLTFWTRYAARWDDLSRSGRIDIAAIVVLLGDIAWIALFVLGTGGILRPFAPLLIAPILFGAALFGAARFASALAVGIVLTLMLAFTLAMGADSDSIWRFTGLSFATIAVVWAAFGFWNVLEREHRTNELVIRHMDEAAILLDGSGRVRLANPQVRRFLGFSARELVGMDLMDVPDGPQYDALRTLTRCLRENRDEKPACVRDVRINAVEPMEVRLSTVSIGARTGSPLGWLIVCQDVTDLKSVARASASSTRVLSHEIRSPLTTLKTIGAVFGELARQLPDESANHMVQILDQEVDRMLRLARQFLDHAAIEENTCTISPQPTDLGEIAQRVGDSLALRAADRGLHIDVLCEEDLPLVSVDQARTEDLLHNLGDNTLKYTPRGGAIMLRAQSTNASILLSVADTGCGIPEDMRETVFEQFVRAHSHGKNGLGLGLYMAREISRMHGGEIELHSEVGIGSTFTIRLPIAGAREAARPA